MKHSRTVTVLLLGLALGASILGGSMQPAFADAPAATESSNTVRATLDNGLRVIIVHDALAPVVTTQITYLTGSYDAPKGFPGTAHALEHMMFRDSDGMTSAQLYEMTGKMGARMNAFTTADATQFFFVAPAQYVDMLLKIESIRMRHAQLSDADWKLEKGAIEQEVSRDISNPDYLALTEARRILFAGTGYAASALGSRPTFDKTTDAILRKFYDHWYQPGNAVLVIVGDVDGQATLAKVKQLFGAIPEHDMATRAPLELRPFESRTIAKTTPDATGTVEYVYRMPGERSSDYAALKVLMDVLNNARSRLSNLAAQGKVLSTQAGMRLFARAGMGIVGVHFAKGGNDQQAKGHLDGVIADLLKRGVSADLVKAAKDKERAQFEFSRNSPLRLGESWSNAVGGLGLASPRAALANIEKVTVADVDRVARKYLTSDRRVTIVLTPSANGKRPPHAGGFGGSEKFGGNDKLDVPLPTWAAQRLAKLRMPHWTLDPVRMTLDNGITLIVQPESISKTVTVAGRIDTNEDLQAPEGQEGVGSLLGSLFSYGTAKLDRTAFHEALDAIAANESAGANFYLAVPSGNFDKGMQLLAANELHPALPRHAFDVQQKALARRLQGAMQSPRYKAMRALYAGLYPAGDPALRRATPDTVTRLTLADVKHYYARTYRPDMTTIVIVGDITPRHARAEVEKYFGAWKATGPKPDVVPKPVPLNQPGYVVVPNGYASQDQVVMAQMLDINIHNPDRYALQLGNAVLGGNGFASRLMIDVRVRHGYAYGARSSVNFGRARSTFFVSYGSDAAKVKAVDGLVDANIEAMRTTPVKPDELQNARQALIRSIPLRLSSIHGIAGSLLSWSVNGEPLNEAMVAARHYLDLGAADVRAAFRKYVHPDHLVQVVQGPKPAQH